MPDALLAVLAFIGGAVTTALIGAGTAEYRARQDHKRAREIDRDGRDSQAAAAILGEVDRLMEKFSTWGPRRVDQEHIEPFYRVMRRRAIELSNSTERSLAEEIADGFFYYVVDSHNLVEGTDRANALNLQDVARSILGAIVRGETVIEPPGLARVRANAAIIDAYYEKELGFDE